MIYAQFGLLYDIILNGPQSNFDPKFKHGPHADGIVSSTSTKPVESVMNQMNILSINHLVLGQAAALSHPTQSVDVHSVQLSNKKGVKS